MTGQYGYAGKILKVDLSSGSITHMPTSDYAALFLGGRGIAAKIYWDEVAPEVKALDPENRLIFMTGPLAGISPGVGAVAMVSVPALTVIVFPAAEPVSVMSTPEEAPVEVRALAMVVPPEAPEAIFTAVLGTG